MTGRSEPLSAPSTIEFDRSMWLEAAVVAGLRQLVNNPIRRSERDRGDRKNFLNDLQGAIGELAALARVRAELPGATLGHSLVDFAGPVDDVDITVRRAGGVLKIEAKGLLLEPNKSWFLVNQEAYRRSVARGADLFLATITSVGAGIGRQARAIPVASVANWNVVPFQYGDPALGRRLAEIAPREFNLSEAQLRSVLVNRREEVITEKELDDAAVKAQEVYHDLPCDERATVEIQWLRRIVESEAGF